MTAGIEAAKHLWLNAPLFAPALENPQVVVRLKQMVTDYSGWHWVNNETRPPSDTPPSE
jgi:hypothetical protein